MFSRRPPAQSAEEIEDPQQIADRDPDDLEREVASEHLESLPQLPPRAAYVLAPGEQVEEVAVGAHLHGTRIVLDAGGLKFVERGVTHDCGNAKKLVWVDIERRPTGYLSRGDHFVAALGPAGQLIARIDTSDSLSPMRADCVKQLCDLAGMDFEALTTPDVEKLLETRPELVPPKLEFEVDHLREEGIREAALGIGVLVPLSLILGGAGMAAFASATPFGLPYRLLGGLGLLAASVFGAWSGSAWRKRRSLARLETKASKTPKNP